MVWSSNGFGEEIAWLLILTYELWMQRCPKPTIFALLDCSKPLLEPRNVCQYRST